MDHDKNEIYRFRTGYLKFKSALVDRNTGLLSYALFFEEIRRFFETQESVAVVALRLAELPRMEAIYGWQACDRLLVRVADAARDLVQGRYGAEALLTQDGVYQGSFVLFLPRMEGEEISPLAVAGAAERLRRELEAIFSGPEFAGAFPTIRFEVGSAVLSEDPFFRFERLVHETVASASPGSGEVSGQQPVEQQLQEIIRRGHLDLYYQPVVDLNDGTTVGYEALVRGPAGTMLETPAVLFSLCEQFGLAGRLDEMCRELALDRAVSFEPDKLLFINIVPSTLGQHPEADGGISAMTSRKGWLPERLVLDVSERRLRDAGPVARQALVELKALGIAVALDNAGSGYATLKLIEDLRPDFVKIDATLVRGIDTHLLQQEVARSVVAVASRIGCRVVAPGIETGAEAEAVRRCGVTLAQGHYLARPRPATDPVAHPGNRPERSAPGP